MIGVSSGAEEFFLRILQNVFQKSFFDLFSFASPEQKPYNRAAVGDRRSDRAARKRLKYMA